MIYLFLLLLFFLLRKVNIGLNSADLKLVVPLKVLISLFLLFSVSKSHHKDLI